MHRKGVGAGRGKRGGEVAKAGKNECEEEEEGQRKEELQNAGREGMRGEGSCRRGGREGKGGEVAKGGKNK